MNHKGNEYRVSYLLDGQVDHFYLTDKDEAIIQTNAFKKVKGMEWIENRSIERGTVKTVRWTKNSAGAWEWILKEAMAPA